MTVPSPKPNATPPWGGLPYRTPDMALLMLPPDAGLPRLMDCISVQPIGAFYGVTWECTEFGPGVYAAAASSQYVDLGTDSVFQPTAAGFTVACLCYIPDLATPQFPLTSQSSSTTYGWSIITDYSGMGASGWAAFRVRGVTAQSEQMIYVGTGWHWIVGVWTPSVSPYVRLYVDGRLKGTSATASGAPGANSQNPMIARRGTSYYNTHVAAVVVWQCALTGPEIAAHYESPFGGKVPGVRSARAIPPATIPWLPLMPISADRPMPVGIINQ